MIVIDQLSKKFAIYPSQRQRLQEWFSFGRKNYHHEAWALRNINLHVARGEAFGLVGMNGSGKSTLLKIIAKTMLPTSGSIRLNGSIAAILELGTGFHPDLTGRENVLINGRLLGLNKNHLQENLEEIASFSELGPYFEQPVRTYSTGMYVRLAFSLVSAIKPDILLVDEALSVGDAYFQQKCLAKIAAMKKEGMTLLFVSHDLHVVRTLCDRVALLSEGEVVDCGPPLPIIEHYNALLGQKNSSSPTYFIEKGDAQRGSRSGNHQAVITSASLEDREGNPVATIDPGQECRIAIEVKFNRQLSNPTLGLLIKDRLGNEIFGTNSSFLNHDNGLCAKGETIRYIFQCAMNLGPGHYTLTVAVHQEATHIDGCYDWADRILSFQVLPLPHYRFLGVSLLKPSLYSERI